MSDIQFISSCFELIFTKTNRELYQHSGLFSHAGLILFCAPFLRISTCRISRYLGAFEVQVKAVFYSVRLFRGPFLGGNLFMKQMTSHKDDSNVGKKALIFSYI